MVDPLFDPKRKASVHQLAPAAFKRDSFGPWLNAVMYGAHSVGRAAFAKTSRQGGETAL